MKYEERFPHLVSNEPHLLMDRCAISDNFRFNHSSTIYPEISSTTVELFGYHWCVFCKAEAANIQGNWHSSNSRNSSVTGHRCTCKGAMQEIYIRAALSLLNCEIADQLAIRHYKLWEKNDEIQEDFIRTILNKIRRLSISDVRCVGNGKITVGKAEVPFKDHQISSARKKSIFVESGSVEFVKEVDKVIKKIWQLKRAEEKSMREKINKVWFNL
jgi:hypothetical protein